nr:deoxynucleoside kinase [Prevotella sp.]
MYIAIAGNIGSGKTTLTKLLAQHYGWTPEYETVEQNPYLDDYYKDIPRWSFNMEVFFLKERFRNLLTIAKSKDTIVQDRSIFEGVYVFVANNKAMGNMTDRDYETYMDLFSSMMEVAKLPDLMIYLRASVPHLVGNIQKRARNYEKSMPIDYLENLNKGYEKFIYKKYKGEVLVIDADNMDFLNNRKDLGDICSRIDARLYGLFSDKENK